jgi:hypothetical protein
MERSEPELAAHEAYGRRAIIRVACRHRLACAEATLHHGEHVHIDGIEFEDEVAARTLNRRRLYRGERNWRVFRSWEAARAWLLET